MMAVTKSARPPKEVLDFLKEIGSKGGKSRAKKYGTATLRKWSKESGAGRPRKQITDGNSARAKSGKARNMPGSKKETK
jgi:hypothetical protein